MGLRSVQEFYGYKFGKVGFNLDRILKGVRFCYKDYIDNFGGFGMFGRVRCGVFIQIIVK